MYNWSTDIRRLRQFPEKFKVWKLENMINFGLGKEKIDKEELVSHFDKIRIDSQKRKYFKFLLS